MHKLVDICVSPENRIREISWFMEDRERETDEVHCLRVRMSWWIMCSSVHRIWQRFCRISVYYSWWPGWVDFWFETVAESEPSNNPYFRSSRAHKPCPCHGHALALPLCSPFYSSHIWTQTVHNRDIFQDQIWWVVRPLTRHRFVLDWFFENGKRKEWIVR